MKPVVAIIGRPNVGKSTLFNRLSWRKKAIVIDEPGATRDRNYAEATWRNRAFVLIDTGGFEPASTEQILVQMREQTRLAMEEADVLLFVMDGRDGLLPADREIAGLLRGIGKPVFFLVNKVDGPRHEGFLSEFYRLGVEPLYPVSAQHGLGIAEVMEEVVAHLPETEAPPEEEARIRIAVMGKPNVGKSSLVNRILGYERSIVNPLPGTTRDPIDTPFSLNGQAYLLVDTAGIRRKSRVSLTLEKYSVVQAIKAVERCDIAVLLLDALEGVTEQDAKIAGLACEQGKAVIVAVNKWDAVEKNNATTGSYVRNIRETFKFMPYAPIVFLSALTGQRVAKIFTIVDAVWKQYTRRVSTAELNRRVAAFLLANPPPHHDPGAAPFQYVTQVAVKPPTFVLFVREPKAIHFSYERYLVNQIREAFGFDLVPIQLFFRRKTRSAKDA